MFGDCQCSGHCELPVQIRSWQWYFFERIAQLAICLSPGAAGSNLTGQVQPVKLSPGHGDVGIAQIRSFVIRTGKERVEKFRCLGASMRGTENPLRLPAAMKQVGGQAETQ
jgi:hypothetical protein